MTNIRRLANLTVHSVDKIETVSKEDFESCMASSKSLILWYIDELKIAPPSHPTKEVLLVGDTPSPKKIRSIVKINHSRGKSVYVFDIKTKKCSRFGGDTHGSDIKDIIQKYQQNGHIVNFVDHTVKDIEYWIELAMYEIKRLGLSII